MQSGILFTLSIHTRGTFAAYRRDSRAHSKKDERNVRLVHPGESVIAFNYARCLIDQLARKQKNRRRQKRVRISAEEKIK